MKIPYVIACFLCFLFTACSQESPPETVVFPPSLNFVEPEDSESETEPPQEGEDLAEEVVSAKQIIPEYATTSSVMPESPSETFTGACTFDGSETTVWAENASGFGQGEWLQFHFPWLEEVQEIWIYNGHGEFPGKYAEITEISLRFSSDEEFRYGLEAGWNMIVLESPILTNYVRLTILNADSSQGENSCVAEMRLFNRSSEPATEQLGKETVLKNMGALGNCMNITPEQAEAYARELQYVMDWAKTTSAERASLGSAYTQYTGEALLFAGGDGVPVLYYDYDFPVVEDMFVTETDLVIWDGDTAQRSFFQIAGNDTNINWILPGYVYENQGEYYFGLTEFDLYGSGSFGLIAMVGFDQGIPRSTADYVAFICHQSRGAYTYEAELADYLKMSYLSAFPTAQLALLAAGEDAYFEYNGVNFYEKDLGTASSNYNSWVNAIRQARMEAGYQQVTAVQPGEVVLAGLLSLATGELEPKQEELPLDNLGEMALPDYE